jgi:nucleobase:cation symporter-1, NCS1 family
VYGANVAVVEPHGLDVIDENERHGSARDLFGLWFGANSETANFAVGILTVALYGTSLAGAVLGLVIGSILGYTAVSFVGIAGPRFGLPQMMISRRWFGRAGNVYPAFLAFLAGVGWFSVDCIFGAQAVGALFHISYLAALALTLVASIVIAVYGYNMIHVFERFSAVAMLLGFSTIAIVVLAHANLGAPFDAHAPFAAGGEIGGIAFSAALAFSYSIGWAPCAADYARYLPANTSSRAVGWWAFAGGFTASLSLEILGAAAATAVRAPGIASATPAETVGLLAGTNGWLALAGLLTVLIGTMNGNVMNLYSGALSLLVTFEGSRFPLRLARWQAALAIGIAGGILALVGSDADATARVYGNFLGLLSTWAAPWAAIMIASREATSEPYGRRALIAWLVGIAAGVPFWQQTWFTGPIAAAHPQIGDLSYFVSFAVAYAIVAWRGRDG